MRVRELEMKIRREGGKERGREGERARGRKSDCVALRLSVSPSLRLSVSPSPGFPLNGLVVHCQHFCPAGYGRHYGTRRDRRWTAGTARDDRYLERGRRGATRRPADRRFG